jgi:hypothetical protein
MKKNAALLLLCFIAASAQAGELFRWVDAAGNVHYTDQPPPSDVKNVEQKKLSGSTIETSELPYATQQAVKNFPVTLYVTDDCGKLCESGRELLNQRGIPYTTKNPQTNPGDKEALKKLVSDSVVPVLVVGSSASRGFNKGTWDTELDSAGYPKSALKKPSAARPTGSAAVPPVEKETSSPHPWSGGR